MCFTQFPHNMVWATIPKALPPAGSEQVEIPPEALENGGMRFRVEATDKTGNVNLALSDPLHAKPGPEGARPPSSRLAEAFARTQGPAPGEGKPGWPLAASLLRGGDRPRPRVAAGKREGLPVGRAAVHLQ